MKIGIYTHNVEPGCSGGVQQYSTRLINALLKYTSHDIYVFTNKRLADIDYKGFGDYSNYHQIILPKKSKFYRKIFYNKIFLKTSLTKVLDKIHNKEIFLGLFKILGDVRPIVYSYKVDVLHFPTPTIPFYGWKIPTIISFHDCQQKYFPNFFNKKVLEYREYHFKRSVKESSHILVSFDHIKDDVIKFYKANGDKITVTSCGLSLNQKSVSTFHSSPDIFSKFKIPNDFLLYPAQTWKHKNHIFLLNVIARYKKNYNKKIFLVCTGKKNENYKNIERKVYQEKLENNVIFTGFVPENELNLLYKKTSLVVIPTLYEAGSFPLLEAMYYERPVICSSVTSLPDTIKDKRFIFDPRNDKYLCDLIHQMLNNENLKIENIKNGKTQIQRFKWENIINNFIKSYEKSINNS